MSIRRRPVSSEGSNELRVRAVLKNELAIGIFAFNRTTCLFGNLEINPNAEWLRVKITEPLVSRALFAAAQHKLGALRRHRYTDEDMIGRLRRLLEKDGHLSRSQIDKSPHVQGARTYIRRFGTLDVAMALAGHIRTKRYGEQVDRKGLKSDEIIKRLRTLLARTGYLNTPLINACPTLPNASTIAKRIGSLTEAYRLAGYKNARRDIALAAWQRRKASGEKGRSSIDTSTMPTEDLAAGVSRT